MPIDVMHLEEEAKRVDAKTVDAPFRASTGKGEDKKVAEFTAHIPRSLGDAVKIEGERGVFERYLQSLAIEIQGKKRLELDTSEGEGRKRASYLESVGL